MPDLESAKKAARAAASYYKELVPRIKLSKLLVEEIEYINVDQEYRVTLSHPLDDSDSIFGSSEKREYKVFNVDAATSTVKSMRFREN